MDKPLEEWTQEDYDRAAEEYSLLERQREKIEMERLGLEYLQQCVQARAVELGRRDILNQLAQSDKTQLERWLTELGFPSSKSKH
jgi:hypothetical protein